MTDQEAADLILGQVAEAVCDDGCGVLANGTGPEYTRLVTERATQHADATGHRTRLRTWASDG